MQVLVTLSLALNVVVLVAVCGGLLVNADWARASYGPATPARGILLSVYLALGFGSGVLMVVRDPSMIAAVLGVQIVYKVTTPLTVGTLRHPVVASNLAIAAFHSLTLAAVWQGRH